MSRTYHHGHRSYRERWQPPRLRAKTTQKKKPEAGAKPPRRDVGIMRWMPRDDSVLRWIADMRAVRFDQLQVLLARSSPQGFSDAPLSRSRSSELLSRYLYAGLVRFHCPYHGEAGSGWISLTWRAMQRLQLPYPADPPAMRALEHLFWINEVRLHLEALSPLVVWHSERSLQADQGRRTKGERRVHLPDGRVLWTTEEDQRSEIDIEVQVSRPSRREVEEILCEAPWHLPRKPPLWYFVTRSSAGIVRNALATQRSPVRAVQVIDLHEWLRR